jgi:hypothetical protein
MGHRSLRRLIVALPLIGVGVLLSSRTLQPRPLAAGSPFPDGVAGGAPDRLDVVWVFEAGDYLKCRTAADQLRRVQRAHGGAMSLTAVSIGRHRDWALDFLRRERLSATLVHRTRRPLPGSRLAALRPAIYLVRDGVVHQVISTRTASVPPPPTAAEFEASVRKLLQEETIHPKGTGEP